MDYERKTSLIGYGEKYSPSLLSRTTSCSIKKKIAEKVKNYMPVKIVTDLALDSIELRKRILMEDNIMGSIVLEIPSEIASQIKLPPKKAKKMLMEELVLRLYEDHIISTGQGAVLLKMDRLSFERFLAENQVSIYSDIKELEKDLANLEKVL
ncbi:MAG: UPF0175 family protein [bacterium]